MAKIVDPDDLNQGTEITITPIDATATDASSGTIRLNAQGNLGSPNASAGFADGVALQTLYSFLKEEWRSDASLIKYPFPMIPITDEQFELTNGWDFSATPYDKPTWKFIRDGGWALKNAGGVSKEEYCNITTLGSFARERHHRAYYIPSVLDTANETSGATPSGFRFTGPVNEALKIYGSASYGNFDFRDNFVAYLREQGYTYAQYDLLTEQNLTTLTYRKYALPLTNASDIKIETSDTDIESDTGAAYSGVTISYYTTKQSKTIGAGTYTFHIIIDGNNLTLQQIYEKVQYSLRQPTNINENPSTSASYPIRGDIADELIYFVGDTLYTNYVTGWGGVFVDNIQDAEINSIVLVDDTNTERQYPFTATGVISFNDNLVDDGSARWWMFYDISEFPTSGYGTTDAIIVKNAAGNQLYGDISGSSKSFTFDYDFNTQPGWQVGGDPDDRTAGTDADVVIVAIGLSTAQFVKTSGTIQRTKTNNFTLVASLERNYSNPA